MSERDAESGALEVEVQRLSHVYGARTALDAVSFDVRSGEIFGLLGPNGGGKSTLFRILTTLQRATSGTVRVAGHDVGTDPDGVRRQLGVVFQHPSLDAILTVEENLRAQGALHGLSGRELRSRIDAQLERFKLSTRRRDRVGTLSGGLARRAEIAKALLTMPRVLVMDEPSAGLDPSARRDLMDELHELRRSQRLTVLLTTHHMEEAERCDRVGVIDEGRLVGLDTPDRLKEQVGGDVVTIRARELDAVARMLRETFQLNPEQRDGALSFEADRPHEIVHRVVERFGGEVEQVSFGRPTLEDAFFHLTGRQLAGQQEVAA